MSLNTRLFLILFFSGFAGVLSFLLIDLSALTELVVPAGQDVPAITPAIKVLSLIQPSVLLAVAVLIGVALAPRVGLSSPVAEVLAAKQPGPALAALRPQLVPGVFGGVVGGVSVLLSAAVLKPFLTTETIERISEFTRLVPFPTRLVYGGITEEVLLRWGFMTLVVWAVWRIFQKERSKPTSVSFVAAIVLSALVFGLGHLPIAYALLRELTTAVILFVMAANCAFGIVAGFLYWKYGLESAIVAHMLGHVVLAAASYAGAYF